MTGGASGIGKAAAYYFHHLGARVILLDINDEKGRSIENEPVERIHFIKTDVSQENQVQAAINQAMKFNGMINYVISCAGLVAYKSILDEEHNPMPLDDFMKILNTNLIGTFNVCRLVAQQMVKNQPNDEGERGVIIMISSIHAFEGEQGVLSYAASKGGIVGMTVPMARDLGKYGIRVVSIAPGAVDTPMLSSLDKDEIEEVKKITPFPKLLAKPEEIVKLCHHILENSFINAETIRIDGGLRLGYEG